MEGAIGAYAPELPAIAVVVGAEIEGAVEIGEAAAIAAGFRSIAAGADLQFLHAAGCRIQPVELPTAGIGVGGEKELAAAAHHRLGIGAVGGLVDVGHPAGAAGGAVAHPQLLVGAAVAGGEVELAAAGGEVGDAGTAATGPDVTQQLGGGVGGGVEAPELGARAPTIGQEEQAPIQRGKRAGVAPAAAGIKVKRPDLTGLGVKPHQLAANAVAAGIGGVGAVKKLAAKGGEPGRIHTHRARHPGEQGSGSRIDLEETPARGRFVGAHEEPAAHHHQCLGVDGARPDGGFHKLHHTRARVGPPQLGRLAGELINEEKAARKNNKLAGIGPWGGQVDVTHEAGEANHGGAGTLLVWPLLGKHSALVNRRESGDYVNFPTHSGQAVSNVVCVPLPHGWQRG